MQEKRYQSAAERQKAYRRRKAATSDMVLELQKAIAAAARDGSALLLEPCQIYHSYQTKEQTLERLVEYLSLSTNLAEKGVK